MPGSTHQMAWNVPEAKMDLPSQPVQLIFANDPVQLPGLCTNPLPGNTLATVSEVGSIVPLKAHLNPGLTSKPRLSSDIRSVQPALPPALPHARTHTLAFVLSCYGNLKWGFGNFLETSH